MKHSVTRNKSHMYEGFLSEIQRDFRPLHFSNNFPLTYDSHMREERRGRAGQPYNEVLHSDVRSLASRTYVIY